MSYLDSNYYDCNMNDDLGLEPRLLEYIKKKKFFKQNNIEIEFLDKEFSIRKNDLLKIKAFMKSDKKNYADSHTDIVDMSSASFPSSELQKDPRMERIKAKQKKETEASEQRHDYGIISKSYDMYRNDRPFASAYGNDFSKSDFNPNNWFKNSKDEMSNLDQDKYFDNNTNSFNQTNTYVNPRSLNNGYIGPATTINSNSHTIDDIIEKMNMPSFNTNYQNSSNYSNYSNKYKKEHENTYRSIPLMSSNSNLISNDVNNNYAKDIDVDSYMRMGTTPLRAGKSLGYPSVMEHSFSYISSDIQDPSHVVMDRGIPSRTFNKENVKKPSNYRTPMR